MPENEVNRDEQIVEKALDYAGKNKFDNNDILSACVAIGIILVIILVCAICIILRNRRYKRELAEDLSIKKEYDKLNGENNIQSQSVEQTTKIVEEETNVSDSQGNGAGSSQIASNEDNVSEDVDNKPEPAVEKVNQEQPQQDAESNSNDAVEAPDSNLKTMPESVAIKPIQPAQKPTMKSADIPQNNSQETKPKIWPGKV